MKPNIAYYLFWFIIWVLLITISGVSDLLIRVLASNGFWPPQRETTFILLILFIAMLSVSIYSIIKKNKELKSFANYFSFGLNIVFAAISLKGIWLILSLIF